MATLGFAAAGWVAQHRPPDWRIAHAVPLAWAGLAVAALLAVPAVTRVLYAAPPAEPTESIESIESTEASGGPGATAIGGGSTGAGARPLAALAGSAVLVAALAPPLVHRAPYAFSLMNARVLNVATWSGATPPSVTRVRERIGADTPVLYFGYVPAYALGNPSVCRYPSPQWLQRAATVPDSIGTASYDDNLRCLTEDARAAHPARYLVLQSSWFPVDRAPQAVRSYVARTFDCAGPGVLRMTRDVTLCPRR